MSLFNKPCTEQLIEVKTELKLMREEQSRMQNTIQTLNKHIKFLVHICKLANPEFDENN